MPFTFNTFIYNICIITLNFFIKNHDSSMNPYKNALHKFNKYLNDNKLKQSYNAFNKYKNNIC